jgi:cytoskeletal protein RodZ
VKLTDQSWVRVVADGKTEFEGMLPEGTQRIWAADKEVTVRAGNAGGVLVSLNEGQAKPMGEPGTVEEVTFGSNNAQSASSFSTTDDRTLTAVNLGTD